MSGPLPVAITGHLTTILGAFAALLASMGSAGGVALAWLNRKKIQEVHVIVNNQRTEMAGRIEQLEGKIGISAGEPIPEAQIVTGHTDVDKQPPVYPHDKP